MALPNIILPPEMTPVGSVRAELIGSGGTAALQDEGEPVGVKLLRELIAVSKDMAENLNVLASIAKMQLEEAKKLAFALDEQAAEAGRSARTTGGTGAIDFEKRGEEEKKGILDNLPLLMFGAGGLAGALSGFFRGLGLTGLLALGAYMLGDDLNKYITELTGNEDMGSLAEYMLYGTVAGPAIAGALQGKKFAGIRGLLIGAIVGLTVGLTDIVGDKVKEATGSSLLEEASKILSGTLGGAAAGFLAFGPVGAIVGAIAGAVITTAAAIYNYFKEDSETKAAIDAELEKLKQTLSDMVNAIGNWITKNLVDPVKEFLGFATSSDLDVAMQSPEVQQAQANLQTAEAQKAAVVSDFNEQYTGTAFNKLMQEVGVAEANRMKRQAQAEMATKLGDIQATIVDPNQQIIDDATNAAFEARTGYSEKNNTAISEGFDFMSSEMGGMDPTPIPSVTGQTAAMQSAAAATTTPPPIVIANQGGDTNVQTINNVTKKSSPLEVSNYDDSIVRSMRNNYALD